MGDNSNDHFKEMLLGMFTDLERENGFQERTISRDYFFFNDAGLAELLQATQGSMDEKS